MSSKTNPRRKAKNVKPIDKGECPFANWDDEIMLRAYPLSVRAEMTSEDSYDGYPIESLYSDPETLREFASV